MVAAMGAVVAKIKRVRACDRFESNGSPLCRTCEWALMFHRVPCSGCGGMFRARPGANSNGYSHCKDHRHAR